MLLDTLTSKVLDKGEIGSLWAIEIYIKYVHLSHDVNYDTFIRDTGVKWREAYTYGLKSFNQWECILQ